MKKNDYIEMLLTDLIGLDDKKKKLYSDVIDCVEISLSKESDNFEVDPSISLDELFKLIELHAKENSVRCVGPFEAAELFAKKFGSSYQRISKQIEFKLEDFF